MVDLLQGKLLPVVVAVAAAVKCSRVELLGKEELLGSSVPLRAVFCEVSWVEAPVPLEELEKFVSPIGQAAW